MARDAETHEAKRVNDEEVGFGRGEKSPRIPIIPGIVSAVLFLLLLLLLLLPRYPWKRWQARDSVRHGNACGERHLLKR